MSAYSHCMGEFIRYQSAVPNRRGRFPGVRVRALDADRMGDYARASFGKGAIEIRLPEGRSRPQFAGFVGGSAHDFRGGSWHVRVEASDGGAGQGSEVKFRVTKDHQDDYLAFELASGQLHFSRKYAGVHSKGEISYEPSKHSFWRIRHEPTTDSVYWETSPDGRSWQVRHGDLRGFSLKSVVPELYAGTYQSIDAPRLVRFASFNRAVEQ